ncbi:zinc finger BED domain-containing protein 4-like [Xyrauchen texanus]|uniref:zinc finger BED domain-containing protein 4-like n=1 Tax=Xyrauchen texanus TaxID=154827 RepID=UPI002242B3FA|nr:zinc finger BED domain-containing protein 4-like [Xyrauchen texanus]
MEEEANPDVQLEDSDSEEDSENEELNDILMCQETADLRKFQWMAYQAHTLYLIIKDAMKHPSVEGAISKTRRLVYYMCKSSVSNEGLILKCGKTLIRDCSTRWNSSYEIIKRLLEIKTELNEVLEKLSIYALLNSDWVKLEVLLKLLEPFAIHTDQLQIDSQCLSEVVPSLLNLKAHLQTSGPGKQLAQIMLKSLCNRFAFVLNQHHQLHV